MQFKSVLGKECFDEALDLIRVPLTRVGFFTVSGRTGRSENQNQCIQLYLRRFCFFELSDRKRKDKEVAEYVTFLCI